MSSSSIKKLLVLSLVCSLAAPPDALAWGERGHHLITRVAVRILAARVARGTPMAGQFARREFMLAHLSNVPDIVWRNQGEAIEALNAPTHFIDLEYVTPELTFSTVPRTPAAALARMQQLCAAPPRGYACPASEGKRPEESSAGTAPWRAAQLHRLMVESLKRSVSEGKSDDAAIDRALLAAGLMSHFVGDLGNPYHATSNYDGWDTGQGGIHSYFESSLITAYPLALDQEVYDAALTGRGLTRVLGQLPAADREALSRDPAALTLALALESHSRLDTANAIDLKFALLKKSGTGPEGKRVAAERRDASELRAKFHDLSVERLSTAAEVLAHLWFVAWQDGGKPDFKGYRSFAYPVSPDFIPPDYLSGSR